jgi:hypothetical protein
MPQKDRFKACRLHVRVPGADPLLFFSPRRRPTAMQRRPDVNQGDNHDLAVDHAVRLMAYARRCV